MNWLIVSRRGKHNLNCHQYLHLPTGKQFRVVIISTVRTRKIMSKSSSTPGASRQKDSSELYYGFLSDPKLLNTAFTRAQSLLVVVGDPVALCSVGGCSTTWKNYLKNCEENKSLLPLVSRRIMQRHYPIYGSD